MNTELPYRRIAICIQAIFLSLLLLVGSTAPSYAQTRPFDYQGDTKRIAGEIQLNFKAGKYEIQQSQFRDLRVTQAGNIISMEGFNTTTSPGDPILPVRIYDVAVPPNIDWSTLELSVKPRQIVTLSGTYDLLPAPPLRARVGDEELVDWGEGKDIVDGRNLNVYGKDRFFPDETLRIASRSQMRKWKFLRLEFTPVQYNPVQRSLRLVKSVQVRLTFKRIGTTAFRGDPLLADTFMDEEAKKRFINFEEASEWYNYVPEPVGKSAEDPDFVIVTTNAIHDSSTKLADFVTHKQALGYTVRVVTEDDYGALPPSGTAEKIRQWLSDNYTSLGIHYVLLIGNPDPDDPTAPGDTVGDIPMQMGWPNHQSYTYRESPTDYFYADLTGNWDLDGDGFFGESASSTHATSPDPAVDPDTFSVRWVGRIKADVDGSYNFMTFSDNGIRLTIDGTAVINNWTSHLPATNYGSLALTAGQHDIQVEYYDETGDGVANLYWQPPGQDYYGIVPSNKLYHEMGGAYVSGGLDGDYFNNTDFTALALTRLDSNINFFWGTGDNGAGGVDFEPEVYVGRIPVYGGDYAALDAILQKTIDYETAGTTAWRRKLLTANVYLWPDQSDYKLGEALKADVAAPLGFSSYRIYESDFGIVPPPECPAINPPNADPAADCNMLGEWANGGGYGLLTWSTHGSPTGASQLITSADNVHLDDATPAFTFQGSCLNGYPENNGNLGYSLLKKGAIGTVSASRVSWNYVFNPAIDPDPLAGNNSNLTYHYAKRIMEGESAGHALYVTKRDVSPNGFWMNKMDYNLYGDPSVRLSSSFRGLVLLFDTSGSMSWNHEGVSGVPEPERRLSLAKEAAYPFLELLADHADRQVNFGISTFPPHPWSSAVGCNGQEVTPMTRIDETSKDTAVTTTIPGLVAEGNTPLLAGLTTAAGLFGTETGGRAIVLLSDGYHNCPSSVDSHDPAVNTLIDLLNANSIKVYTIGFGRPTDIDHSLLQRLAEDTGGQFYDVTTPDFDPATWSPATDLQLTYKAILVDALGLETVTDPLGAIAAGNQVTAEAKIGEADRRVSFFLSWQTPQKGRLGLKVRSADGQEVPLKVTTPGVGFSEGKTYKILTVDRDFLSQPGKVGAAPWTLEIDAGRLKEGEQEYYQYSVILDSGLKMETLFRPEAQWAGDTFILSAKITAGGQPVTGLTDISVQITRPREGFGNWFVTNEVSAEELQKVPVQRDGESLSPVLRKALYLTDIQKVAFPARLPPGNLPLYDDGSHGDAKAGDGIYTNRFKDTAKEGTYTFHFQAKGQTDGGSTFERDEVVERYLKVKVSPKHTLVSVERLTIPDSKLQRFRVVLTPRDALGNFLGPRSAKAIQLSSTQGKYLGTLQDNLNGSYSQVLELPVETNLKQVVIGAAILGTSLSLKLSQVLLGEGGVAIQWLWLAIVILSIIIVGLTIWVLMMRQSREE